MNAKEPGKFYLQGTDVGKERFPDRGQINFEWNIVYSCNYRCTYCIFAGRWEEYSQRTVRLSVDEWLKHWRRIHDKYGRVSLLITGGEPFVYPEFIPLMRELSKIHYPINISTNSSGDMERFVREIDPKRVSLTLSFHPEFNSLADVLRNVKFLKEHGFLGNYINFCAYPPFLADLTDYVRTTNSSGETMKVIPFCGLYKNSPYPDSYSQPEKEMLGINSRWEKNVKRKGTLCAAGQRSALLFPDGKVVRCGQIGERHVIGDFFSDDFELLDGPKVCDVDLCPCLKAIPVDGETV